MNTIAEKCKKISPWMAADQLFTVKFLLRDAEVTSFFVEVINRLDRIIDTMPATYETDYGIYFAYLHYFIGGCDWWICEKDIAAPQDGGEHHQAYGVADIGYGPEYGYISIPELRRIGAQLDFHFVPEAIGVILARKGGAA